MLSYVGQMKVAKYEASGQDMIIIVGRWGVIDRQEDLAEEDRAQHSTLGTLDRAQDGSE